MRLTGQIVKMMRIGRDMKQAELAKAVGVSRTWINYVENGHRNISFDLELKLRESSQD